MAAGQPPSPLASGSMSDEQRLYSRANAAVYLGKVDTLYRLIAAEVIPGKPHCRRAVIRKQQLDRYVDRLLSSSHNDLMRTAMPLLTSTVAGAAPDIHRCPGCCKAPPRPARLARPGCCAKGGTPLSRMANDGQ